MTKAWGIERDKKSLATIYKTSKQAIKQFETPENYLLNFGYLWHNRVYGAPDETNL